jgi:flagellar motor protein MotB
MKARITLVGAIAIAMALACGTPPPLPLMADIERARSLVTQDADLSQQALAEADAERAFARADNAAGHDVSASLHAERAIAAYQRARMVARASRATADIARAEGDLGQKTDELHSLEAARKTAEREGEDLEKRILIAREMRSPLPSGPADAQREAARLQASRALSTQARLLCGAAKLVAQTPPPTFDAAMAAIDALDKRLEANPKPAPIDEAARVRTTCLTLLSEARRTAQGTTQTDVLLSELSAASLAPNRDERGVVVTLRDVFHGNQLAPDAETKLEALGRVAAAHADVGVQVVAHDAAFTSGGEDRAKAAAAAIVKGGAKSDRVTSASAGTRTPVVDPNDARNRARNARLDVVFVTKN